MEIKTAIKRIAKKIFTKENISTGMRLLIDNILAEKKGHRRRARR